MGQFKPMVKMETTEPSVELKLKKGGAVKKANGGAMVAAMPSARPTGAIGAPRGGMAAAARPGMPSMAARRAAMAGRPMMAEGGESKAAHKAEMSKMKGLEKELKSHESKPASKGHKGLKTGGVAKSPKPGNYATGGVVNGQGGYKKGGAIAKSGIINTEGQGGAYRNTKMDTSKVDTNSAPTGDVKLGNAGGYKKGGATKKHYATGGAVNNSGHAVAMPKKPASRPVSNDRQSGTFKKGGTVDLSKGAYDKSIGPSEEDMDMAKTIRDIPGKLYRGAKSLMGFDKAPKAGSVTETEKSVTVEPAKKRGGSVKC